jgi:diaminopimelate decarboxylase
MGTSDLERTHAVEPSPSTSQGFYLSGSLCLESDLIYKHKIFTEQLPRSGDLVIFINTAGYYMDFNHIESVQEHRLKLSIIRDQENFLWYTDENYFPTMEILQKE